MVSDAGDADAFYEHYDKGTALLEGPRAVAARKALGLATTPPTFGEVSDSGDGGGDGSGTEV
jgi:hypothetical protein